MNKQEFLKNPPKAINDFNKSKITYNQKEVSKMSCTLNGALTVVSNLFNYEWSLKRRKELWDVCKSRGASDVRGWTAQGACDVMIDECSRLFGVNLTTITANIGTPEFYRMLEAGYMGIVSGRLNNNYWNDVFSDGDIDNDAWEGTDFGHIWTVAMIDKKIKFVENYKGKTHNVYNVTKDQLESLTMVTSETRDNYFAPTARFLVDLSIYDVSEWAQITWNKYKDIFDYPLPKEQLTAMQFPYIFKKYGDKINKELVKHPELPFTQESITILLDRLTNLND